jgi:CHAT domain-containing protein/tetratricopeptide (TPR) repeat protein
MVRWLAILYLICSAWNSQALPQHSPSPHDSEIQISSGVVVEKVVQHGEGEKAGLYEGDVLLSWSRGESKGEIESPFDLAEIETEQKTLGMVKLEGLRGTERRVWPLGPSDWGLTTRPNFAGAFLTSYREGQDLAKTGKPADIVDASKRWKVLAGQYSSSQAPWLPAWLFFHGAELLRDAKQWKEADDAYQLAVQSSSQSRAVIAGRILRAWADAYQQRNDWPNAEKYFQQSIAEIERAGVGELVIAANLNDLGKMQFVRGNLAEAERCYRQALEIQEKLAPGSLDAAASIISLGNVAIARGALAQAEQFYRQALEMREKLAPGSLDVAAGFMSLGNVAYERGDLAQAEQFYRQALDMREKLAPGSLDVAASFDNLGMVALYRGELAQAEQFYRQAFEMREKVAPGSLDVAASFNDLGMVAFYRGEFAQAEQFYRRALEIREKLAPESLDVAAAFMSLGEVANERGELAQAEQFYRRALEIREKLAPGSLDVAAGFLSLGTVAFYREELQQAEQYYRQALEIREKVAPNSLSVAASLDTLAEVAKKAGDLVKAEQYYDRALAIREALAPRSLELAQTVEALGDLARQSSNPGKAEQYYRRAVTLREKLGPGSWKHAESLIALASVLRGQNQLDAAAQFYTQAVNAVESQTARLGGSEDVRSGFRSKHSGIYKELIDLLLLQKQTDHAFEEVERSRARTLLEMLEAAHLDIRKGADPSLLQQERSLQETRAAKSDRLLRLLREKNNEKQVAAFTKEIEDLDKQYQEVEERLRLSRPSYAALTQPHPLTAGEIRQLLDPNTLLLEYFLGDDHSYVFTVTPDSLTVHELPARAEIEEQSRHLYSLLTVRNRAGRKKENVDKIQARVARADSEYVKAASGLSRVLLGAVGPQLGRKRLLIVADGGLLYVPFAALPEPETSATKASVPLMVAHEVVNLPSASTLAMLRREHSLRANPSSEAVIFADPVFDVRDERLKKVRHGTASDGQTAEVEKSQTGLRRQRDSSLTRSASDLGLLNRGQLELPRLLFTRREADAIVSVTAPKKTRELLDFDANRKLALSGELSRYRIVHFATHALVDDKHPDLSGLVLSLVDRHGHAQQGFLDLEDIYNLDLTADLVVLSACDTAVGKQVDGEGMIGLTRGFMYAGASNVMGTLWSVDDFAAAKLMKAFYTGMEQDRMPPAQALRQAQLALWKEKHWSSPYYWAPFTLQGDWK